MSRLIEVAWPQFGQADIPPDWRESPAEYEHRWEALRAAMDAAGLTHLALYGDREHFGNLVWACGFDPRFEEALFVLDRQSPPLLLVGNECRNYVPASPVAGRMRIEHFPDFSLPDQPRPTARTLAEIFASEGIDAHARVGLVGWKRYAEPHQTDVPSYLADALRFAAGWENVSNAFDLTKPLRQRAAAAEIAWCEWTNTLASEAMRRVIRAIRPGKLDYELLEETRYCGVPLACHMTLKCGENRVSVASARGERVVRGGRFSCGICYWGANCCRCGWVVENESELPTGYVDKFAGPYFDAMGAWFDALRIGTEGAALERAIHTRLDQSFNVFLNAGHLIHYEEWLGFPARLESGMIMQSDVIPSHPEFYSSRMEDGYCLADAALQTELQDRFPALLERAAARRRFMRTTLGLPVHDDVLPLSNLAGIVPPMLLHSEQIFTLC